MNLKYKGKEYGCVCRPSSTMIYNGLPDNFPAPVDDILILCTDDGFVLREDNPNDYLRQTFSNGTLTLTNTPEPEPVEPFEPIEPIKPTEPVEPSITIEEVQKELLKTQKKLDAAIESNAMLEECIVEMAEIVYA